MNIEASLLSLIPLNAWARCAYEQALDMGYAKAAVYDMKRRVILESLMRGICKLRAVQVERPCKTCKGTGTYEWIDWHDEYNRDYQDCRRCGATGTVKLQFVETNIHGCKWHTPSNRAEFLRSVKIDWTRPEDTDWTPEQPARILERLELIRLLNAAERAVFENKMLRWYAGWRGSVYDYHLHLGSYAHCFVCGREQAVTQWSFAKEIYRPGLRWDQGVCDACESRANRWPRQWPADLYDCGRWQAEHPKWQMCCPLPELAYSWDVTEWLARRGIAIGRVPPAEYGFWQGGFVDVVAHRNGSTLIRVADPRHWLYRGASNECDLLSVPAGEITGRKVRLLEASA